MYESPINQILGEMQVTYENECMKAVQSVGFDINKEELTKALMYDRNQYEKGYRNGYIEAIDDFAEKIADWCDFCSGGMRNECVKDDKCKIYEMAEQLKR